MHIYNIHNIPNDTQRYEGTPSTLNEKKIEKPQRYR